MDVTIIGAGSMARAIARVALAGGRSVELAHPNKDKAAALADELRGAVGVTVPGAAIAGAVVVLAVPYEAVPAVVDVCGGGLAGRVVVDIGNPVDWSTLDRLVTPPDTSAAEQTAALVPAGAAVVKAFNTTFAGTLRVGTVSGQPLDVFVAGDDAEAKLRVTELVDAGGLRSVDVGGLRAARELEAMQLLHLRLQRTLGLGYGSSLKLLP